MCTLSWARDSTGVEIFFNRDEQRSRPQALSPTEDASGVVAPVDPQGGGTWIFANPAPLCGALLNTYDVIPQKGPSEGFRSRGLLMRDLASVKTVETMGVRLQTAVIDAPYPSFFVVGITPETARGWHWNGEKFTELPLPLPMLTTSGHKPDTVVPSRIQYYRACTASPLLPHPGELERFHTWHDPENPEISTYMSRSDARTVSFTRIHLRKGHPPRMTYTPRPDPNA
ncbi:MAG: NRDE family protein [Kiritimatiellae bacterium]|jgi:hypothetical protein|nr:NRDE family protein [Kiritimatiellia bacterium]